MQSVDILHRQKTTHQDKIILLREKEMVYFTLKHKTFGTTCHGYKLKIRLEQGTAFYMIYINMVSCCMYCNKNMTIWYGIMYS